MSEYDLIEPFDIDGDELDGLRPKDCFVLGYELCLFHQQADKGNEFSKLAHAENVDRISAALNRRGLEFTVERYEEPSWVTFHVKAM